VEAIVKVIEVDYILLVEHIDDMLVFTKLLQFNFFVS